MNIKKKQFLMLFLFCGNLSSLYAETKYSMSVFTCTVHIKKASDSKEFFGESGGVYASSYVRAAEIFLNKLSQDALNREISNINCVKYNHIKSVEIENYEATGGGGTYW